jgi:single-strand DNA-binding protein
VSGINKTILIGNVGSVDIKPKLTTISLATGKKFKDKNTGEMRSETQWHRLKLFGRVSEIAAEYVKKGDKLYVEGELSYGKYTGSDGLERYTTDIIVRDMQMLGAKETPEMGRSNPSVPRAKPISQEKDANADFLDDEIPF